MPQISSWLPVTLSDMAMDEQQKRDFVRDVAVEFISRLQELGKQLFPSMPTLSKDADVQSFSMDTEEMLLDVLFEHDFLPTYAFPREVRSFVIDKWVQGASGKWRIGIEQRPQQSVDIALSEYTPGRELIVDKATYRVGGIYVDPFPGATLATRVSSLFPRSCSTFSLCMSCGYTLQIETKKFNGQYEETCPLCKMPIVTHEILDPPGYAPERARSLEQSQLRSDKKRTIVLLCRSNLCYLKALLIPSIRVLLRDAWAGLTQNIVNF